MLSEGARLSIFNLKNILVFTSTRADYGIMYWMLREFDADPRVCLKLLVSGTHLSSDYGLTYEEIIEHGFCVSDMIEVIPSQNSRPSISRAVGFAINSFTDSLNANKPDSIIVLGDRYEVFAAVQAAFFLRIPIVHLHGGEITEGANDDRMRHAITKLADLHFTSCEVHRKRVIQMGEAESLVMISGAPGLEHTTRSILPKVKELTESLNFDFSIPYILIAFHPVTNADDAGLSDLKALLSACSELQSIQYVISLSNADFGATEVNKELLNFSDQQGSNALVNTTFGHLNFLAIMRYAELIIGNSSSGVIEAPSLYTKSVDIGIRQKGRERATSVLSCDGNIACIRSALKKCMTDTYPDDYFINPYYRENSSKYIVENTLASITSPIKKFIDIDYNECNDK